MNKSFRIILSIVIVAGLLSQKKIYQYLGFGENNQPTAVNLEQDILPKDTLKVAIEDSLGNYFVSDSVYEWDETQADWVAIDYSEEFPAAMFASSFTADDTAEPIAIDWELLMRIKYKLKYYEELEAEMYAPVFTKALKAIDGKEVIIKGYIIPIEVESDLMALSANPYSSCFFCGKASPASVLSLYLKKKKTFKMDAFKKFKGTLHLNYDDPSEFYYILRDAVPVE